VVPVDGNRSKIRQMNGHSQLMIHLISNDQVSFHISKEFAILSKTLHSMIHGEDEEENEEIVVPLLNVDSGTLSKILEFCKMYSEFDSFEASDSVS
jgi:hypothetical protein